MRLLQDGGAGTFMHDHTKWSKRSVFSPEILPYIPHMRRMKEGGEGPSVAVIGIDQVVHGDRREGNTRHPNELFFNFANPAAAKNNTIQGAADLFQLVSNLANVDYDDGGPDLDTGTVHFYGHSLGGMVGTVAVFKPQKAPHDFVEVARERHPGHKRHRSHSTPR